VPAVLLLLLASPVAAEVTTRAGEDAPGRGPAPRPVHDAPLRAECWQEGVKIIDQADLRGLALPAATRESTVSFKGPEAEQASVFLLPLADALCLIRPEG